MQTPMQTSANPAMAGPPWTSDLNAAGGLADRDAAKAVVAARFLVTGCADPGLLPRLIEPFAKLGLCPSRVLASREAGDGSELSVDLRLTDVSAQTARLVEVGLKRVIGVQQLLCVVEQGHG